MRGQLSFFAAQMQPPVLEDLEGLLAGPAQAVRKGDAARLSVVVRDPWRVEAVLPEFAARGLAGEHVRTVEGLWAARSEFSRRLLPLAGRWWRGTVKAPPDGFQLDGARLRLWAIVAGRRDGFGYVLQLGSADQEAWATVGAALAAAGVAGTLLGPRAGGPAYRITGRRRLNRLAELVGDPPAAGDPAHWPAQ